MKQWLTRMAVPAGAAVVALAVFADAGQDEFAHAMHQGMTRMMADMERAGMSGDPDRDFLAMMIPHHAGAVEMARLELIHGRDPLTRRLAEDIIASQTAEIAAMRERLALLKREGTDAEYPAIHGTRGDPPRN